MEKILKKGSTLYFSLELVGVTVLILAVVLIAGHSYAKRLEEQYPGDAWNGFAKMEYFGYGMIIWAVYILILAVRVSREIKKRIKRGEGVLFHLLLLLPALYIIYKSFSLIF